MKQISQLSRCTMPIWAGQIQVGRDGEGILTRVQPDLVDAGTDPSESKK